MRHERTRGRASTVARTAAAAALTLTLAAVAACGGAQATPEDSPAPVRIGALYNLTGSQAGLDIPSLEGARLAVDRINANGGLMGRRVELLERDGQTDVDDVRRAVESLVAAGVTAIVGLSDTGQVLAAAPIAAQAGIPFVTSGATSPKLPEQVPSWLFLACFGDNAQAAAAAEYAYTRLGARTAVVLYDDKMEFAQLLAGYFSEAFDSLGGEVTVQRGFTARAKDRREAVKVTALAARSADLVFVASGPDDAGELVRRLRAAGVTQPIFGGDSFDGLDLVKAAEDTGGDVYYTTHAATGLRSASAAVRRFSASYDAAYGRPPQNAFAVLGYDAVDLVAAAVRHADSVRPAAVRDALLEIRRFAGVSGTFGYDGGGVPHKEVTVVRVGVLPVVVAQFTPSHVPPP